MSGRSGDMQGSSDEIHAMVLARLRKCEKQMIAAILATIPHPKAGLSGRDESEFLKGRVAAVEATVRYSLDALAGGGEWGPVPEALAAHARRCARIGLGSGILVRRYLRCHEQCMVFIREETERSGYPDAQEVMDYLRANYAPLVDHIVSALDGEYEDEHDHLAGSPKARRADIVRRLLVEDLPPDELEELGYPIWSRWHLAVIARGEQSEDVLGRLKPPAGRTLLSVRGEDGTVWAFYGGRSEALVREFARLIGPFERMDAGFVVGYPGRELDGLRQSHREAEITITIIGQQRLQQLTRSADLLPLVGAANNETTIRMYETNYILPLNKLHKRGQPARRSLLAYFDHGHSVSNAALAINVTRQTIKNHLKEVNEVLDQPVNISGLETALRLEALGHMKRDATQQAT